MNQFEVDYVSGDDWQALYIGGRLVVENYRLSGKEIVGYFHKRDISYVNTWNVDSDWLEDRGRLPELFSEIPDHVLS